MMKIELSERDVVRLLMKKMLDSGCYFRRGTYNQQDPTCYVSGGGWVVLQGRGPIDDRWFEVTFNDVSWGIEVKIDWVSQDGKKRRNKVDFYDSSFYYGPRAPTREDLQFIMKLLMDGEFFPSKRELDEVDELSSLSLDMTL